MIDQGVIDNIYQVVVEDPMKNAKADWTKYLKIERRINSDFNGYGIYTLSHNECVGECLTQDSAEYHADFIAQGMAPKSTSNRRTKAELIAWMNRQRRMHTEGRLSADKIQKLESIPGWTWTQTTSE
ncbi:MAG: helicase associated domain-containing protein [Terracidiphilus sp.]